MEILDQIENKVKSAIATISALQARIKELEDEKAQYQSKLTEMLSDLQMMDEELDLPTTESKTTAEGSAYQAPEPAEGSTPEQTTATFAPATTQDQGQPQSEHNSEDQGKNAADEIEEVRGQQAVAPNQLGIGSGDHSNY